MVYMVGWAACISARRLGGCADLWVKHKGYVLQVGRERR